MLDTVWSYGSKRRAYESLQHPMILMDISTKVIDA
jgi:hypothetical protein